MRFAQEAERVIRDQREVEVVNDQQVAHVASVPPVAASQDPAQEVAATNEGSARQVAVESPAVAAKTEDTVERKDRAHVTSARAVIAQVMWFCPRSRDHRSKSRDHSRSRHRSERKKKSHRSEKKEERKYSQSRSRTKSPVRQSPTREKTSSRSSKRSADRKLKKISEEHVRDYDAEEKIGMDDNDNGCEKSSSKSDNMDISP